MLSSTYRAGSFRVGEVYELVSCTMFKLEWPSVNLEYHVILLPYRLDVILEGLRDGLSMFSVLFRDKGEIADLKSIVDLEVFERLAKVLCNLGGRGSGERAPR